MKKLIVFLVIVAALGALAWGIYARFQAMEGEQQREQGERAVPVAVTPVQVGPITRRRVFSGTLEPNAQVTIAPRVSGYVQTMAVDLSDTVKNNTPVATLDRAEYLQAIEQARAELKVAEAQKRRAEAALELSKKALARTKQLNEEGIAADEELEAAQAEVVADEGDYAVAVAQVDRARAQLETAKIRRDYTTVIASWDAEDAERIVAERHVDPGDAVSANQAMLTVVDITPIRGIINATEKDYGRLSVGQQVDVTTDAFAGETFTGTIRRISPVFREASRQARIEVEIENADRRLKPGMFIRATVELQTIDDARIVPEIAIAQRADVTGIFLLDADADTARWTPVTVGIRSGDRVQVSGADIAGRVITLGQHMLDDGSKVRIADETGADASSEQTTAPASDGGEASAG